MRVPERGAISSGEQCPLTEGRSQREAGGTLTRRHVPQLAVVWESPWKAFCSSFRALLYGPAPPKTWPAGPLFRDAWIRTNLPRRALLASALWHIIVFNINVPFWAWFGSGPRPKREYPRIEVTWYSPARDLPLLAPPPAVKKIAKPIPQGEPPKPLPPRGADAYHPRQIILSAPARPTHPRQTLLQPNSPPEPPKILPALPNIVHWNQPVSLPWPKLKITQSKLRQRQATRPLADIAAPSLVTEQRLVSDLNISPAPISLPKPRLTLKAGAVPRAGPANRINEIGPAPDVPMGMNGVEIGTQNLIALSANPAEPAPVVEVPAGNLSARVLISPEGKQPGAPGGADGATPGATGGSGGGPESPGGTGTSQPGAGATGSSSGPPGISISGGNPANASTITGPGGTGTTESPPMKVVKVVPLPDKPTATVALRRPEPSRMPASPGDERSQTTAFERMKPGAPPEEIFGPKRVYTLNINAPNLASVTGSWVLQFAELNVGGERHDWDHVGSPAESVADLIGPVPLQKVDPKYPPALITARVQGDVILYAIIRKDGTVDSIQLVKGLEPRLDQNAMEALARWRFRPAERKGGPVELEAIVRIPFRAVAPF